MSEKTLELNAGSFKTRELPHAAFPGKDTSYSECLPLTSLLESRIEEKLTELIDNYLESVTGLNEKLPENYRLPCPNSTKTIVANLMNGLNPTREIAYVAKEEEYGMTRQKGTRSSSSTPAEKGGFSLSTSLSL